MLLDLVSGDNLVLKCLKGQLEGVRFVIVGSGKEEYVNEDDQAIYDRPRQQ